MLELLHDLIIRVSSLGLDPRLLLPAAAAPAMLFLLVLLFRRPAKAPTQASTDEAELLGACAAAAVRFGYKSGHIILEAISPSVVDLCGYEAEALTEKEAFFRMVLDEDAASLERRLSGAIQDERAVSLDARYIDADGRLRVMQVRVEPSRDARGRMTKLRGVLREITELRVLQSDLAAMAGRFHTLADATPAMLWVIDAEGAVTGVNRATERFCAVGEAALLGDGWLLAVPDDERESVQEFVHRVLASGSTAHRDVTMVDPDNRDRRITLNATAACDADETVRGVILTGRDITDQTHGEQQRARLARIIESSESPALIVAPDFRVAMLNPAARTRAGLGERESADSIALWHVVTQETVEAIKAEAIRPCREGGTVRLAGRVRDGADDSLASELTIVGLGDGWLGITAREIQHEIEREDEARRDRRRLAVMSRTLEILADDAWAAGRAAQRIADLVAEACPTLRASFSRLEAGVLTCEASAEPAWMGSAIGRSIPLDPAEALSQTLVEGRAAHLSDVWDEPALERGLLAFEEHAVRSLALCPIPIRQGAGVGVFALERHEPGEWTRDETELLRLAGSIMALAVRAEDDRRERIEAESSAAQLAGRWRGERDRAETLAGEASEARAASTKLTHRLRRVDQGWLASLDELAGSVRDTAPGAASALHRSGLTHEAARLGWLAYRAERASVGAKLVADAQAEPLVACDPSELLREVGGWLASASSARGTRLRVVGADTLPGSIAIAPALFRVACAELFMVCMPAVGGREVRAAVSAGETTSGPHLTIEIERSSAPGFGHAESATPGAPTGLTLLRAIAERTGGELAVETHGQTITLSLRFPFEPAQSEGSEAPGSDRDTATSDLSAAQSVRGSVAAADPLGVLGSEPLEGEIHDQSSEAATDDQGLILDGTPAPTPVDHKNSPYGQGPSSAAA